MRHKKKGKTLGRKTEHKNMMLRNLASSIVIYEKVKTTEAKAKEVRPLVEKAITIAKDGDLHARRKLISLLPQENATKKLVEVLGEKYKERPGGYTRIVKIGHRKGDGAQIVQIELV